MYHYDVRFQHFANGTGSGDVKLVCVAVLPGTSEQEIIRVAEHALAERIGSPEEWVWLCTEAPALM